MKPTSDYERDLWNPRKIAVRWTLRRIERLLPRPAFPNNDGTQRFVLFGQGRSGSTLLVDLAKSHDAVHCDGEIYHSWVNRPEKALLHFYEQAKRQGAKAYGFKLLIYHMEDVLHLPDRGAFLDGLLAQHFRIVHLRRENGLRVALSNLWARRTSFHRRDGQEAARREPIAIERDLLFEWLEGGRRKTETEKRLMADRPHLLIRYEEDLENPDRWDDTMARFFEYIGVEPAPVRTDLKRVAPRSLEAIAQNADEVRQWLRGTPWEKDLEAF
jgi:hypothetical protein